MRDAVRDDATIFAKEIYAVSRDGGQSWQILHRGIDLAGVNKIKVRLN